MDKKRTRSSAAPFTHDLSVREIFLISSTIILISGLTYAGLVINDLYSSKKALAELTLGHELSAAKNDIDHVFFKPNKT